MLFNSPEYFLFFLIVLTASWVLVGLPKLRIWVLLLASYYFYASNNGWLTILIVFSTQFDFIAALKIAASRDPVVRKTWLTCSMIANLGLLGFFKYANFLGESATEVAGFFGMQLGWFELNVLLPVGISFYTFEAMSYVIDVYRRDIKPERKWHRFAFFIVYFPQLIAGPIVRAGQFLPQLDARPRLDVATFEWSITRIFRGLFKKIVLADTLALIVDAAYADPSDVSASMALIALYAFTLQIYFDFSGYTDIAIGCARLMGFQLPENFRNPYASTSITDFWRRWHLSLSTWLRDYLYFPLGGSRMKTRLGVCRNLIITMTLAGLWHGAAWHFVFWGVLNGMLLAFERLTGIAKWAEENANQSLVKRVIISFIVFNFLTLLWVPFRAPSIDVAYEILLRCFSDHSLESLTNGALITMVVVLLGWGIQVFSASTDGRDIVTIPLLGRAVIYGSLTLLIILFNAGELSPFIYFRF